MSPFIRWITKENVDNSYNTYKVYSIELNMDKIIALCKKYKVSKLFVFGSILTNRFNKESDVDFIVNFDKAQVTDYFNNFFNSLINVFTSLNSR